MSDMTCSMPVMRVHGMGNISLTFLPVSHVLGTDCRCPKEGPYIN